MSNTCSHCERELTENGICTICGKYPDNCTCNCVCGIELNLEGKCSRCNKKPSQCDCNSFVSEAEDVKEAREEQREQADNDTGITIDSAA